MKSKVVEQLRKLLKEVTAIEDIAEIERTISEVKGELLEPGFWEGKRPCWEMCQCPEMIRNECPALKHQSFPCWEIEGTYCKLDDYGVRGDDISLCQVCRVYKTYGENKLIQIRLWGKGINTSFKISKEGKKS